MRRDLREAFARLRAVSFEGASPSLTSASTHRTAWRVSLHTVIRTCLWHSDHAAARFLPSLPVVKKREARESALGLRLLSSVSARMLVWAIHALLVRVTSRIIPFHNWGYQGTPSFSASRPSIIPMHTQCAQQMASPTNMRALDTPPRARYTL